MPIRAVWSWLTYPTQRDRWAAFFMAITFIFVFTLSANYVMNQFYHDGAGRDTWFLAALVWHNDPSLTIPAAATYPLQSYLANKHLSFLLIAPALLSYLVPIGMYPWYAIIVGIVHATVGIAFYHSLARSYGLVSRGGGVLAALLALGFASGGVPMAALQLPHFELLIVGFGLLFLAALAAGDARMAWVWLLLTLSVREDAGFHLFGFLLLAQLVHKRRDAWPYLAVACAYSVAAFGAMRLTSSGGGQFFVVYAGDPPYAHLTMALLADHLRTIWNLRTYLWLPQIIAVLWAILAKDPMIVLGFVAILPWTMLSLTAVTFGAGTLDLYYPFPFLLALAWPTVGLAWQRRAVISGRERRLALSGQSALVLAALCGWIEGRFVVYPFVVSLAVNEDTLDANEIEDFRVRLAAGLADLGTVRADFGGLGLLPDVFRPTNGLRPEGEERGIDTVVWFDPGSQDSLAWDAWLSNRLDNQYRVVGSNILLASDRRLERSPALAPCLVPANPVWRRMRPTSIAERAADGFHVPRERPPGLIAGGPHTRWRFGLYLAEGVSLAIGRYEARFEFRFGNPRDPDADLARTEVGFAGGPTVASLTVQPQGLPPESLSGRQSVTVTVPFEVDYQTTGMFLQLRALHLGNADVTLRNIALARLD
jgi:hypothetical protein